MSVPAARITEQEQPEELSVEDVLAQISAAPSAVAADRIIGDYIAAHRRTIEIIARRLLKKYIGLHTQGALREDWEDAQSLVGEQAAELLRRGTTDRGMPIENFWGMVNYTARDKIKQWAESGAFTGFSGAVSVRRRQLGMAADRAKLRDELGREPTSPEIAHAYNSRNLETRKDAAQQGALSTDARDFLPVAAALSDELERVPESKFAVTADEAPLFPTEARDLVGKLIAECYSRSEKLGLLAATKFGGYLQPDPVLLDVRDCADALGWSYETTYRAVNRVNLIARELLSELYGIESATGA